MTPTKRFMMNSETKNMKEIKNRAVLSGASLYPGTKSGPRLSIVRYMKMAQLTVRLMMYMCIMALITLSK